MMNIFVSILITFLSVPHFVFGQGHRSYCNQTTPCNKASLLTCQESTCQCILPDSMVYIPSKTGGSGQCVSLVDEACGHMSMDTSEVVLHCVENSFCNTQGECQCQSNYFKSYEGLCLMQKGFGEVCNASLQCSLEVGLFCVNDTCQCDSSKSIDSLKFFDEEESEHRCLGRPSQPCLNGHCVPNSTCKEIEQRARPLILGLGAKPNVCECDAGFEESKSKKVCLASFNKTCDTQSNRYCKKDLSCVKGVCGCKYPAHQVYDKDTKSCTSLIGGPCTSETGDCVANAVCKRFGDGDVLAVLRQDDGNETEAEERRAASSSSTSSTNSYNYCECEEGFVENVNRTCDVAYGHPCSQMLDEWKCDTLAGLTCRDGFCACPDPGQIFDKELMKCRSLVGSFCDLREKHQCIRHSHCKPHRSFTFGHCECDEDYKVTKDRVCLCQYCSDK